MILRIENLDAIDRLQARFERIANPDARGLMATWIEIIKEDNRRGVLAGLDKDGIPLPGVKYRPIGVAQKLTKAQRGGLRANARQGRYSPAFVTVSHGNLSSSEYRKLDGPPLAPRRQFSRVITNLKTDYLPPQSSTGGGVQWEAFGWWDQVVSSKAVPFLIYHFTGAGNLPVRNLAGVRPEGVQRARETARNWMMDIVRNSGV